MITQYWKAKALNSLFRSGDTAYVGLSITTPTEDGNMVTEPTDSSYIRTEIKLDETFFKEPINGVTENIAPIVFVEATGDWATGATKITNWTLYDSLVGGKLLAYGLLTPSKAIESSDVFSIPSGKMIVRVKNES